MDKKTLNKVKQRDKKRNPHKMRVDDSARKFALIKRDQYQKLHNKMLKQGEIDAWFVPVVPSRDDIVNHLKSLVKQGKLHQADLDEYLKRVK